MQLCERRARAGDYVLKSSGEDGNAIHLAFDQDGVIQLADGFFGVIEIEENFGFRVDGCFGRVEIFRPGFFVRRKCPPSESDDLSGFAGNGKHHPVAELGVHVYRRTLLGAPTLVIPTEGRNLLFYSSIVITSEFRRFVCGVAGRVEGFAVYLTADG